MHRLARIARLLAVLAFTVTTVVAPVAAAEPLDLSPFFLDTEIEIALARSAAPAAISADASVLVLADDGYRVAVEGTSGFTCMVLRSWSGPNGGVDPRVRAPICYNPPATASVLQHQLLVAERLAAGEEKAAIDAAVEAMLARGELRRPGPGALGYMMSAGQWLNERVEHFVPHLMFFQPGVGAADVGNTRIDSGLPFVLGGATGDWGDITVMLPESSFVEVDESVR